MVQAGRARATASAARSRDTAEGLERAAHGDQVAAELSQTARKPESSPRWK
jgi:hypothetical protein